MGFMDDSVGRESSDHKGDSYQKHCIKVVTKVSGCCIDENRGMLRHTLYVDGEFNTLMIPGCPLGSPHPDCLPGLSLQHRNERRDKWRDRDIYTLQSG
jgi:hypothetical protein